MPDATERLPEGWLQHRQKGGAEEDEPRKSLLGRYRGDPFGALPTRTSERESQGSDSGR